MLKRGILTASNLRQSLIMLFFRDNKVLPHSRSGACPSTGLLANICPTDSASAPLLILVCSLEWQAVNGDSPLSPSLSLFFSHSLKHTQTHRMPLPLTLTKSSSDEKKTELGPLLCPFLPETKGRLWGRWGQCYHCGNIISLSFPLPMCCCYPQVPWKNGPFVLPFMWQR